MRSFRIKKYVILILFSFMVLSCKNSFWSEFYVEAVDYSEGYLVLNFSEAPDKNLFLSAFSFYEDDSLCGGRYYFSGREVRFLPNHKISDFHDYEVTVSSVCEDCAGHSLSEDYVYKFSTKTDYDSPFVEEVFPAKNAVVNEEITSFWIRFSERISESGLYKAFSVSPAVDFHLDYSGESGIAKVFLEEPLSADTFYTVSISEELCDLQNNYLKEDYSWSFEYLPYSGFLEEFGLTVEKIDAADGAVVLLGEDEALISWRDKIRICFNAETELEGVSSYISVSPEAAYTLVPDYEKNAVELEFSERLEWGNLYTLCISEKLKDKAGREIGNQKNFPLRLEAEGDRPVEFLKGYFSTKEQPAAASDWFPISMDNIYSDLSLPVTSGGEGSEYDPKSLYLYLLFSISNEADSFYLPSVLENVEVSVTNTCAGMILSSCTRLSAEELYAGEIADLIEAEAWDFSGGGKLCGVRLKLCVQNFNSYGLIRFGVGEKLSDNLGNEVGEELLFSYNKL